MQKISSDDIITKFCSAFKEQSGFSVLENTNPLHISYNSNEYYIFFRNVSHGGAGYPEDATRVQLPEKEEFECVKGSDATFFLMGYDQENDVFVTWEPQKVKSRLNDKGYVSFFARKPVQKITDEGYIVFSTLSNGDFFCAVKTKDLPTFFNMVSFFPNDGKEKRMLLKPPTRPEDRVSFNEQVIYYGVPGSGKSKKVNDKLQAVDDYTRIVFHADFSNSDFLGQILPESTDDGDVKYRYKPSAFVKMLREAYINPTKKYALVIEELNRGNAPSIFGALFQLLDRKKKRTIGKHDNGNVYDAGWSDYSVSLENVNEYFRSVEGDKKPYDKVTLGEISFGEKEGIRFPKNLAIFATMNTSDQNVFTLDHAFQRRWKMELVSSELNPANTDEKNQMELIIEGTEITWDKFRKAINRRIVRASSFSSLEDKRLGGWFVQNDTTVLKDGNVRDAISVDLFANKVIKYLWDDAFKFDRSIFNDNEEKTLEDIINEYKKSKMDIFDSDFKSELTK